jgi:hypothetical protein
MSGPPPTEPDYATCTTLPPPGQMITGSFKYIEQHKILIFDFSQNASTQKIFDDGTNMCSWFVNLLKSFGFIPNMISCIC